MTDTTYTTGTFTVEISVTSWQGSPVAAAIYQGYGPEWLAAYLRSKMPAGSPVIIQEVTQT